MRLTCAASGAKTRAIVRLKSTSMRGKLRWRTWAVEGGVKDASSLSSEGLLVGVGEAGAWDCAGVGKPVVRCFLRDDAQKWVMWYQGRGEPEREELDAAVDAINPCAGATGLATSTDGIQWSRGRGDALTEIPPEEEEEPEMPVGKVFGKNSEDWWVFDTAHVALGDVQILSSASLAGTGGVYWMFYAGGDFEPIQTPQSLLDIGLETSGEAAKAIEGLRTRPGLALSQDGVNWARIEAGHHSGALFDTGEAAEFDELGIASPQVVPLSQEDLRMYYHTFDAKKGKFVVGLARSRDGMQWKKMGPVFEGGDGSSFDARGAACPQVVYDPAEKKFLMFYEGVSDKGRRSIGMAASRDGLTGWQSCEDPILSPSKEGWDMGSVGAPCAVSMAKGRWRLYYSGSAASNLATPWEGIGLALSDGANIQRFHRRKSK